eukprot:c11427_g1_i1 orf=69-1178(+)
MGEPSEMTPWEHHASATGLPRFNYKALSTAQSLKGFLITCSLDREKSATKEALTILRKYLRSPSISERAKEGESVSTNVISANQHLHLEEGQPLSHATCTDGQNGERSQATETAVRETANESATDDLLTAVRKTVDESTTKQLPSDLTDERHQVRDAGKLKRTRANFEDSVSGDEYGIFFLKMAQKGIISVFWERSNSDDPVVVLSKALSDMENGSTPPPRWCQRMVPVQASCVFSTQSLSALVIKLVKEYLGQSFPSEVQPLKYAISFNRRGFKAREVDGSKNSQDAEVLDRMSCIRLVTAAVANATPHTLVDLTAPQMVVIVEVIPLAGVQNSSPVCGVAVLSGTLMNTKPKLCVKSLVPASCQAKQ